MFDRVLNPAPTIYKWDRFETGFIPGLFLPVVSFLVLYGILAFASDFSNHEPFPLHTFFTAMQSNLYFLRISTVCCMPNAALFFFFIRQNYNNASRAVVLVSVLYVMAIIIKDLL